MGNRNRAGHPAALFTIIIWGTTFISTKVLLVDFRPVEILFFRFVMGFAALLLVSPHRMKGVDRKQEMTFVLAVLAAFVWACYSILTRKISSFGYPIILTTRRTFFYGILFMIPALFFFDFKIGPERFADVTNLFNLLYLGLGASALCFVTWNLAVKALGAVRTSVYIYMVPVITVATSVVVLREPVTWVSVMGTVLAVAGLFLSEYSGKRVEKEDAENGFTE